MTISNPTVAHRPDAPTAYSADTQITRASEPRANETKHSYLVKTTDGHTDYFLADRAWFFVVLLSIGYMVSRGLAKCGTRHRDDA